MLASLVDLKQHLNITSTSDDEELQLILDAAERVVTSIAGSWSADTVTESVPVVGGTAILSRRPTGPVTSGGVPIGGTVDGPAGLVTGLGGLYGSASRITVTYSVGDDGVPADVYLATLIVAAQLFETQRRPGFSSDAPAGFGGADGIPDATSTTPMGFAVPSRAQELLAQYTRPSVA